MLQCILNILSYYEAGILVLCTLQLPRYIHVTYKRRTRRDYFMHAPMRDDVIMNALYHWLGACTKWPCTWWLLISIQKSVSVHVMTRWHGDTSNNTGFFRYQSVARSSQNGPVMHSIHVLLLSVRQNWLTHWGRDKIDAISQTTFSNAFSWMKMHEFRLRFHWSLFLRFELTIFQYWFRYWLGAGQATSHYLNQWWLDYRRIYASLGLNELTVY